MRQWILNLFGDGGAQTKRILHRIQEMEQKLMSAISDYATKVTESFTSIGESVDKLVASADGITKDIAGLKAKIDELQNSPGAITPQDQALLDASQSQAAGVATRMKTFSDALAALDAATEEPPTPPTT